jgi:8-oxo-dGTP diphosphatase
MLRYVPSGDEERAFLAAYRLKSYARPAVSADVVAITWRDDDLAVLLIQRARFPHRGSWALPGGFVDVGDTFDDQGEDLAAAAARELHEECGLAPGSVALRQLGAFGAPNRDPRTRLITVTYLALLPPAQAATVRAGDDASHAEWVTLARLHGLDLAFDHADILETAIARLRVEVEIGPALRPLLPEPFTGAELRARHRALWGSRFDAARFRRVLGRLRADGVLRAVPGRPTRYRFA